MRRRALRQLILVASVAVGIFVLYMSVGTRFVSPLDWFGPPNDGTHALIMGLRLKRALLALVVGAALALSGAGFQALLRNPLADPFITGVSGGAAIGGTLMLVFSTALLSTLPLLFRSVVVFGGAFAGAVGIAALLYTLSRSRGVLVTNNLLLMGVVFNFFASAVILFLKTVVSGTKLQEVLFWLMGMLSGTGVPAPLLGLSGFLVVLCGVWMTAMARRINLVSIGDEYSYGAGVDPERIKKRLFLLSSLLVAVAVSLSGFIGFVGLVVPHVIRLLVGADHRHVLPLSALGGAAFLLASDLVARLSFPWFGTLLPVGVVTAFVGGPMFIALLARSQRRGGQQ